MTSIFSFIKRGSSEPAVDPIVQQRATVRALKEEALARAAAEARSESRMPTMTDYFIACELLGQERKAMLDEQQIQWGSKVYVDMSGLTIQGFLIRKDDLMPPADVRTRAMERAKNIAGHQGRQATTLDMLYAIKAELDTLLPQVKVS